MSSRVPRCRSSKRTYAAEGSEPRSGGTVGAGGNPVPGAVRMRSTSAREPDSRGESGQPIRQARRWPRWRSLRSTTRRSWRLNDRGPGCAGQRAEPPRTHPTVDECSGAGAESVEPTGGEDSVMYGRVSFRRKRFAATMRYPTRPGGGDDRSAAVSQLSFRRTRCCSSRPRTSAHSPLAQVPSGDVPDLFLGVAGGPALLTRLISA
jgi:hypothetical protein